MRHFVLAAGAAAVLALAASACSSTDSGGGADCSMAGAAQTVAGTGSITFSPSSVTVTAGQKVCWENTGSVSHTVTDDGGAFNGQLDPNGTFTNTFATAGTFPYHCTIHAGMVGTVIVN